jgi:hypothetical protein
MGADYCQAKRTVPYRQTSGHPGPFGCDVWKLGLTSHWRIPAVVVTVKCTWTGAKPAKRTVQLVAPGQLAVWTVSGVPTGTAAMVIGPGGAFWISTVRSFTQPIAVQTVVLSRRHAKHTATAATVTYRLTWPSRIACSLPNAI